MGLPYLFLRKSCRKCALVHFLRCLRDDCSELQNGMCVEGGKKALKKTFLRNLYRDITVRTQDGAEKKNQSELAHV